jgi:alpha-amylase
VVFERIGKALIGVTDKYNTAANNSQDEEVWVSVGDATWRNIDLYDYSGAHGVTPTRVFGDGRVLIKTAPVGHTIAGTRGHGYSIWAPKPAGVTFNTVNDMYNYLATYVPSRSTRTVQEWEMANDLGDNHVKSLRQGGALPGNSTAQRTAGRIYVQSGTTVTYKLSPEVNGRSHNIALYNTSGTLVSQVTGVSSNTAPLTGTYTPSSTGWYTIKIKNSVATQAGQKVWVNVSYIAPASINTRTSPGNLRVANPLTGEPVVAEVNETRKPSMVVYPNPASDFAVLAFWGVAAADVITLTMYAADGKEMFKNIGSVQQVQAGFAEQFKLLQKGVYLIKVQSDKISEQTKIIKL